MALDDDQIRKLRTTLATEGWREVIEPLVAERGHRFMKMAFGPVSERPEAYRDAEFDFFRGVVDNTQWMLTYWKAEIDVHNHNETLLEQERDPAANP